MSEKQDSNSHCSQLKLDWKTCQGTVEQPQLSASYWRNLSPVACAFNCGPMCNAPPPKFPKQTHTICWVFSLPGFTRGLVCQVLCSERAQTTAQLKHEIISGQDSRSPRAFPTCSDAQAQERNPVKNSLCWDKNSSHNSNLLKHLRVNVFRNKPESVSSFLYPL